MSTLGEPNLPPRRPRWLEHAYDVGVGAVTVTITGAAAILLVTGLEAAGDSVRKVTAVIVIVTMVIAGCGLLGKLLRS